MVQILLIYPMKTRCSWILLLMSFVKCFVNGFVMMNCSMLINFYSWYANKLIHLTSVKCNSWFTHFILFGVFGCHLISLNEVFVTQYVRCNNAVLCLLMDILQWISLGPQWQNHIVFTVTMSSTATLCPYYLLCAMSFRHCDMSALTRTGFFHSEF